MNSIHLAIGAADSDYCRRLCTYLGEKHQDYMQIQVFSDPQRFFCSDTLFHAALLEEDFFQEDHLNEGTRYIFLNDGEIPEQWREYPTIYKYQSADSLLREVFALIGEYGPKEGVFTGGKELIGVYSPHGHDQQSVFSIKLAKLLAQRRRTLYLNFTDCAGLEERLQESFSADITDLLYYVRNHTDRFLNRLHAMLYQLDGVEYVPPATNPEILHEARQEDYEKLLTLLCERTDAEVLVLDFGAMLPGFGQLLRRCDRILCPMDENPINSARLRHFQRYLSMDRHADLGERIRLVPIRCEPSGEAAEAAAERIFQGGIDAVYESAM